MSDRTIDTSFTATDDSFSSTADRVVGKIGDVGASAETAASTVSTGVDQMEKAFESLGDKAQKSGDDMDEGVKKPLVSMESLEEQALHVGERIAEAFAIREIVSTAVEAIEGSIEAFEHEEDAVHNVEVALRAQGDTIPGVSSQYESLAAEIEHSTSFSRDSIENVIAVLTTLGQVGPGNMKAVLTATLDLAQGLAPIHGGIADVESASRLMAVAMDGNTQALGRFIPELKGVQLAAGDTETVLAAIEKHFGGEAAASVDTLSGKLRQHANEWDHVKAVVGSTIVDPFESHVLPVLDRIASSLMPTVQKGVADTGAEWKAMTDKIANLGPLTAADGVIVDLGQNIGGKVSPAVAALRLQHEQLNAASTALDPTVKKVATSMLEEGQSASTVYTELLKAGAVTQAQKDKVDALAASVKKAEEASAKHAAAVQAEQEATRLYGADLEAIFPAYDQIAADIKAGILNEEQIADKYDISKTAVIAIKDAEKDRAEQLKADWEQEKSVLAQEGEAMRLRIQNEDRLAQQEYQRYEQEQRDIKQEIDTYAAGRKQIEKADAELASVQDSIRETSYERNIATLRRWETDQLLSFHGTADQYDQFADEIHATFEAKIASLGPEWEADLGDLGKAFGTFAGSTISGLQNIGKEAQSAIGDFQQMGKGISAISNADSWVGAISGAISFVGALSGAISVISSIISGIGSLFGGSPGRDAVKDFAASYGGFDVLHSQLDQIPGGEDLWVKLSNVGSDDKTGAQQIIAQIQTLFANYHNPATQQTPGQGDTGGYGPTQQNPNGGVPPKYATGGYVDRPTYALVGEAGPEIISPIPQLQQAIAAGTAAATRGTEDHLQALRAEMDENFTQLRRDLLTILPKSIRDAALTA